MSSTQVDTVSDGEPGPGRGGPSTPHGGEGYQRGLGARQIQMIAIGGAIGTGLFLGAGKAISKAGPSLILAYAIAGLVIFFIMRALGELLMYRPVSGSFSEYAREFIGPFAGFVTGWTYWLFWVVTGITEVTAAAQYMTYWFDVPQWVSALLFTIILYGANLISVKIFGELEFWFSMVKVTAIVGMILICVGILTLGFSDAGDTATVAHLWNQGGFFPEGIGGTLMTLQIVMFAFLAVELVGVTAGESKDPEKTLPKAINTVPWRIAVFYVGALVMILSVVPWTEFQPGISPFVAAFEKMGLGVGAAIVNFVVLTAALSSCNSGMYSTGRMLRDLALNGQGPKFFTRLTRSGTPLVGTTFSAALMMVGVWINYQWPGEAFNYVVSFATISGMWAWVMILVCQIRYRAKADRGELPVSSFRAPGAPFTSWFALCFLALVVVMMGIDPDTRISLYCAPLWAAILLVSYRVLRARDPQNAAFAKR
ncbi:amino acid permease [Streptomyces albidoflavus]|uniref:Amino acid permease n=2 Tax=Streptomyces TaxID=1883 RepID=A0AB37XKE5_9ACTN|nr:MULTISPECIES: amino acid permease [Streptomyces]MYQ70552.1 amino acid permease [Streptomyces sp. SID4934]MYW62065.1 amino acid permease [Streptomyces sp. SID8370]MYW87550.1 amino acid permease [Streptomyces sp. SID8371]MYX50421.1 amino acid permease [Streptomyces sp. SID8385]QLA56804.1 amino acid permease [Streptomyces violascens]SCD58526.1 D-serine/D-alanine/glycine:proton symporter, AAT family [Streptomyces sp. IgraMP-1]BDH50817.1 alanine glycine permease [Streptomyces albus]